MEVQENEMIDIELGELNDIAHSNYCVGYEIGNYSYYSYCHRNEDNDGVNGSRVC